MLLEFLGFFIIFVASLIVLLTLASVGIAYWRRQQRIYYYVSLLQGAAGSLVRAMENNPRTTARKNRVAQERMFLDNVVTPTERLKFPQLPLAVYDGEVFPKFITEAGESLNNYNREETNKFWFKAQGIRNGIQIFLDIVELRNILAAHIKMIDHMKRQRDEFVGSGKKGSPNLSELKMVLHLPTDWPSGLMPETWENHPPNLRECEYILAAVRRYKSTILYKLEYKIWPEVEGEERQSFSGDELLDAMRDYVR